ncbi:[similarity to] formylmethanofuran dehydrogenase 2 subunit C AltName: Full=Tungsten-containing formylmethanofuran dehydrogenase II subunit C [methanotrophic bacterial endosymbiont of Bathymodiolus sp.]|jgi:formylmethanofuran dehydrogenase subunit C|nr:[similarity to] formylmethanofuran dehydrogenase 2 subunit C AltName: Full=Tungsten-containing formylmethanofuran dehydrogenase II subunit C [methanotrophic bacterial endosymbiont of Bathymodiolus sp.]
MSALTFSAKHETAQRVDMSPLVCQLLKELSLADIAAIELQNGKRKIRVDELFDISGEDSQDIIINNSYAKLDFIGKELASGRMTVQGEAGAYFGMGMKSGELLADGSVGLYAACEMKNGLLTINGDAGDFLGAALPGNKQGMKGGTVLVKGNVGQRAGDHMRRGIMLIEGNAGDYCGSRMVAGTIAVMGSTGRFLGYAMQRGTILLWKQPQLSATFNDCGSHTLAFLPILFKSFTSFDSKFAKESATFNRVRRYGGDMAEKGRAEVLVKLQPAGQNNAAFSAMSFQ